MVSSPTLVVGLFPDTGSPLSDTWRPLLDTCRSLSDTWLPLWQSNAIEIIIPRDEIESWEMYILAAIGSLVRFPLPVSSPDAPFQKLDAPFLTPRVYFVTLEALLLTPDAPFSTPDAPFLIPDSPPSGSLYRGT